MTIIRVPNDHSIQLALMSALAASLGALMTFGCAAPRPRADAMTPAAHRALADDEKARAQLEGRITSLPSERSEDLVPAGVPVMQSTNGETDFHLLEAARHAYHARAHREAARQLERAEIAECAAIPDSLRSACPLMLGVSRVRELNDGIRIELRGNTDIDQLVRLMRCHLAFARVRGFDVVSPCPLYTRGVDIRRVDGKRAIDVIGADADAIAEIRTHAPEIAPASR